jgi:beta-N-acetylhexosaminidase
MNKVLLKSINFAVLIMKKMKKIAAIGSIGMFLFLACSQGKNKELTPPRKKIEIPKHSIEFKLSDYLTENKDLDAEVEKVFASLDDTAIVAQLIMPAVGRLGQTEATIKQHIKDRIIGGVLMLNGTKDGFTSWIKNFEAMNDSIGNIPFLYSADAEPSLVNRKIEGSVKVKKANEMTSIDEVTACAKTISSDLNAIGINYNFSPVVDMSPNTTVGFRSFGKVPANIIPWSNAFIQETQAHNILATAKHFPGHGLVSGDTHKSLQMIDGELKEIGNYPELIKNGVLSIMVAHIGVKNNSKYDTKGMPATTSEIIVKGLLREEYGFKGLIVTDAMNMGGVASIPQAEVKAVNAGCDIVLMPLDSKKAHADLIKKYNEDKEFKAKVDASAKRIIRMKICVGLLKK